MQVVALASGLALEVRLVGRDVIWICSVGGVFLT